MRRRSSEIEARDSEGNKFAPSILLVDDDEDSRIIFSAVLKHAGFRVYFARDGAEAVDTAWRMLPDVILMDLAMPVLDGESALVALRADEGTACIPVLALTGSASLHHVPALREAGFHDVLLKPIPPYKVLRAVEQVLGGGTLTQAAVGLHIDS